MKNPIVVALDVDDINVAKNLFEKLKPLVGGFKVGPRLTFKADPSFLKSIADQSLLFFDHKFFDIPNTTLTAVRSAAEMGAEWVTVHALNGPECLEELKKMETKIKKTKPNFKILVVTVLTSFTESTLPPIWKKEPLSQSVMNLAQSAFDAGLENLVCSPHEIEILKAKWPNTFLVVPGIRPEGSETQDQKRIATPKEALASGASALVIGRPILESKDPVQMASDILKSLELH